MAQMEELHQLTKHLICYMSCLTGPLHQKFEHRLCFLAHSCEVCEIQWEWYKLRHLSLISFVQSFETVENFVVIL